MKEDKDMDEWRMLIRKNDIDRATISRLEAELAECRGELESEIEWANEYHTKLIAKTEEVERLESLLAEAKWALSMIHFVHDDAKNCEACSILGRTTKVEKDE